MDYSCTLCGELTFPPAPETLPVNIMDRKKNCPALSPGMHVQVYGHVGRPTGGGAKPTLPESTPPSRGIDGIPLDYQYLKFG
jgi:hypothetical protein